MPALESQLETWFRVSVHRAGGYTFKLAPTEAGVPDRLVVWPGGRIYLVELKRTGAKLSAIQSLWHNRIKALGAPVVVLAGREAAATWIVSVRNKRPPVAATG